MKSVVSYKQRGPYGKSSYRGNCSGYVVRDLIEHFSPSRFVDVCEGSGTSRDVCKELNIPYVGLDLHKGFDFTRDSVLTKIGSEAPMVWSHPPYHNMIDYQTERTRHMLGGKNDNGTDLSSCESVEEFLEKSQLMLFNQREATCKGGIYASLIGDYRKGGKFYSFQSDFIHLMPKSELVSVTVKLQYNELSSFRTYKGNHIPIIHEYLLIWKKSQVTLAHVAWEKCTALKQSINSTWRNFVRMALMNLGGEANLSAIYSEVERIAYQKVNSNSHYREKVRQQLQMHFNHVRKGVWAVAA